MAAFGAELIIITNTSFSTTHISQLRISVVRVYGAKSFFILLQMVTREVLPQALYEMPLAISLSLVLTIINKIMFGATYGLGTRVNDSLSGFEFPRVYALIFRIVKCHHLSQS
jgi:ABC-type nitrate/sulfonate/bicarbonate transport system permease component